jgi:hypothetical protein
LGKDEDAAGKSESLVTTKTGGGLTDEGNTKREVPEPQLRATGKGQQDEQVVQSNTYKERYVRAHDAHDVTLTAHSRLSLGNSSHTRDDRRSASGRVHEQEMNRQLGLAMRGFSAQAPERVRQEAGEKRSVHYSCEVIPQQTLKKVATVQGVDLYLEDGVDSVWQHTHLSRHCASSHLYMMCVNAVTHDRRTI